MNCQHCKKELPKKRGIDERVAAMRADWLGGYCPDCRTDAPMLSSFGWQRGIAHYRTWVEALESLYYVKHAL